MRDIIAGLVLIAVGLWIGDSIFQGRIGAASIIFDGLGSFWVIKGIYGIYRARTAGA